MMEINGIIQTESSDEDLVGVCRCLHGTAPPYLVNKLH